MKVKVTKRHAHYLVPYDSTQQFYTNQSQKTNQFNLISIFLCILRRKDKNIIKHHIIATISAIIY